jgi:lysophospholipase L1-like esterase
MPHRLCLIAVLLTASHTRAETLRIITLGDSITKGVRPGVTASQTFASLLQRDLQKQGIRAEVLNAGVGGETTEGALKRLAKDVLAKKPHLVTVMYGTNDCYVDRGKTDSRVPLESYQTNLANLVAHLQKAGIQVVLMTEPAYAENGPKNGIGEDSNLRLGHYMKACRFVAKDKGVPLVDHFAHWTALLEKKVKLAPWTTDGYHLSPRGHEDAAHRILQVMLPFVLALADQHDAWETQTPFRLQLDVVSQGYDGEKCWVHPRAGVVASDPGTVVMTMQKLLLKGSDVFDALSDLRSDDLGKTWSPIRTHTAELGRRDEPNGIIVAACDFSPKWHAKTGTLLGIGQTVRYQNNKVMEKRQRETCYAVYDEKAKTWSAWRTLAMPEHPKFYAAGAGSAQRVDLPNGDILLPIYFKGKEDADYSTTVARCTFDGVTLKYVEHGDEFTLNGGRGLFEPSLTKFQGKFYLTMRHEHAGYVSVSEDGLHFTQPRKWTWDDGAELGTYNTQSHWVSHADALYLVYTRKGANNDHVFRHRAPLFIARVDPERLHVLRRTESIAVPERGARLGNFGVVDVSENETWITVAEWMQTWSPHYIIRPDNIYGGANRVYAARLRWTKPNSAWNQR